MDLEEIFQPRARVNVFTNRRVCTPSCNALVEEGCTAEGLTLRFDADDLAATKLVVGDVVQIGFGNVERGMYFTSETTVISVDGTRVRVRCPDVPQKQPRRAHCRAPIEWGVVVDGGVSGTTSNISASGALIVLDDIGHRLAVRQRVALVVVPPDRPPLQCTAEIVREHRDAAGRTRVGVRFVDLAEADEMKLQLLVLRATARRYLRARVDAPGMLVREDGRTLEGVSENLSGNGVLLGIPPASAPVKVGDRGSLVLRLAGTTIGVDLVEVIRLEPRPRGTALALSYLEIGAEQRRSIVEFVLEKVRDV